MRGKAQTVVFDSLIILAITFALLEGTLRIGAWLARTFDEPTAGDGRVIILALGESTTRLGGVDSYPAQLNRALQSSIHGAHVVNLGRPTVSTKIILTQLEEDIQKYRPQLAILMMGVNDFATLPMNKNEGDLNWSKSRVIKLLQIAWLNWKASPPLEPTLPGAENEKIVQLVAENDFAGINEYLQALPRGKRPQALDEILGVSDSKRSPDLYRWALRYLKKLAEHSIDGNVFACLGLVEFQLGLNSEQSDRLAVANHTTSLHAHLRLAFAQEKRGEREKALETMAAGMPLAARKHRSSYFDDMLKLIEKIPNSALARRLSPQVTSLRRNFLSSAPAVSDENQFVFPADFPLRHPDTAENYLKIVNILRSKGVKVIAMQYPLLSAEPLKKLLRAYPEIPVVENRKNFESALLRKKRDELFWDNFAGEFGHATRYGNSLIVENVSPVVARMLQ